MKVVADCGLELFPLPPYSPDLAPSDYHLFSHMKIFLRGRIFQDDEETKEAVMEVLVGVEYDFFRQGTETLKGHYEKCVAVNGNYLEQLKR